MAEILGQDDALDLLRRARATGRVHHAWVFAGPTGVGKFTTALALARELLTPEDDPEGRTATLIAADAHPDLHVIRKELALYSDNAQLRTRKLSNIPLDVLREHMIGGKTGDDKRHDAPAYRTAVLGHNKVFIIDEAELIDTNGQNALLKTLEEPPPGTYIFLITDRPERLLPTIRSRCQHAGFTPLDAAAMAAWWERSPVEVDPADRPWIERFANGAPGVVVRAVEAGLPEWRRILTPMIDQLDRGTFPATMGETMAGLVETYATEWVRAHKNASKDAANKDGAAALIGLLAMELRERLAAVTATRDRPAIERQLAAITHVREAERQLRTNVNLKQVFENLPAQWARPVSTLG
ncbi:MAG: AAA family ATPase [Phycisphaerales bacterium]|nr:AAA family ATPase [Phycisphaerae bacterium]NNF43727.1 AAA family ATPase [Phycisphaerales bacterium]NNM25292.1 AAA family ATPase [Phycisphaerales bacterium]